MRVRATRDAGVETDVRNRTLLKVVQDLPHARFKPFPPPTHGAMQGILDDYFGGGAK